MNRQIASLFRLCAVAFGLCVYMGRKSLVSGLCALMGIGYLYGVLRANLPDGYSHLIFDAGTFGIYVTQLTGNQPLWQHRRSEDLRNWMTVLVAWPILLFFIPMQDPLIQLVGLRGSIFLLSLVLCAAMMPVKALPSASWPSALGLGFVSAVFDNIPLTALALRQGGYD